MNAIQIRMALLKAYKSGYDKGINDSAEMVNRIILSQEAENRKDW